MLCTLAIPSTYLAVERFFFFKVVYFLFICDDGFKRQSCFLGVEWSEVYRSLLNQMQNYTDTHTHIYREREPSGVTVLDPAA